MALLLVSPPRTKHGMICRDVSCPSRRARSPHSLPHVQWLWWQGRRNPYARPSGRTTGHRHSCASSGTSANGQPRHGRALIKLVVDGNAEPQPGACGATDAGRAARSRSSSSGRHLVHSHCLYGPGDRPTVSVRASYLPASDAAQAARVDVRVRLPEDTVKRKPRRQRASCHRSSPTSRRLIVADPALSRRDR